MKTTDKNQEPKELTFTSPEAEAWYKLLFEQMSIFVERKKGGVFRGIVFNIGDVFPEDRYKIRSLVQGEAKQKKPGGGAKITRASDQNLSNLQPPCDGCPGSAGYTAAGQAVSQKPKTATGKKAAVSIDPDKNPFESVEDILDRFKANANAMKSFCQVKQIDLHPSISKAKTIAGYILSHYNKPEEDQNEEQS